MDKNNVAFYVSEGKECYPAGSFYGSCCMLAFRTEESIEWRFNQLHEIFNRADAPNMAQLSAGMPGVFEVMVEYHNGRINRGEAILRLVPMLQVAHLLIFDSLPDLRNSVKEYANVAHFPKA